MRNIVSPIRLFSIMSANTCLKPRPGSAFTSSAFGCKNINSTNADMSVLHYVR